MTEHGGRGRRSGSRPSGSTASVRRQETILGAARALIVERGVDKLVIADVAERADVSVATIYNLIGTRDRLLIALLDDVAQQVRTRLENEPSASGIDGCMRVITTACEAVLADADAVRAILANLGNAAPDQWLDEGMESSIRGSVEVAVRHGALDSALSISAISTGIQLGFRGVLISWVFGLMPNEALTPHAEYMALNVLVNAASSSVRSDAEGRLNQLAAQLPGASS
jgi:AcrR family transcriptional regulator